MKYLLLLCVIAISFVLTASVTAQVKPNGKAGRVAVCKEIDDNWKCVGESSEWPANKSFNVLFENPTPVGVDFIGIVIHRQESDGKDGDMVKEYEQNIGETNRKYATVTDDISLPAGTYTLYIISWGNRETMYHKGNFADYFAKTTLRVK